MTKSPVAMSLGLLGDGDEWDLVRHVEQVFRTRFPDDALRKLETVGDIWVALESQLLPNGEQPGACHSAMAFYRLRAVARTATDNRVTRRSAIPRLQKASWKESIRAYERASGLTLPAARLSLLGALGRLLVCLAMIGVVFRITRLISIEA